MFVGCQKPSERIRKNIEEVSIEGVSFPVPKFDKNLEEILNDFKNKYHADLTVIGRPVIFNSKEDYDYWLRVEFLNPNIEDKEFKKFSEDVALSIFEHLSNDNDFKKNEVSAVTKKGFIITLTSKKNEFFYLDSLR